MKRLERRGSRHTCRPADVAGSLSRQTLREAAAGIASSSTEADDGNESQAHQRPEEQQREASAHKTPPTVRRHDLEPLCHQVLPPALLGLKRFTWDSRFEPISEGGGTSASPQHQHLSPEM